ncbi:MAG: extracellular solute-binding protein [Alphaproteobacteria bacterium]|nr:extracellular solute-binding protein [Alphaproteobacteria bacterium]MDA7983167.1 extracellular solute-binding protein [Alphaproteobacteria bacterium]MDA7988705.1 extracellular solute-binding protein [Alphaproteobacteria bacterium]MDA8008922.1 extracellular solute-binding protein [Alphaproteobacteria bacterium]
MKNSTIVLIAVAVIIVVGIVIATRAPDTPEPDTTAGNFAGTTIEAKLIGGIQYESLYARIAEWESATGASVNIISKKSHFEIDKEIKSDMAAGSTSWCVGSNHSSFAPQYEGLYIDLAPHVPAETVAEFVPGNIRASTVGGELLMLPRAQFDVSVLYYLKSNYEDAAKAADFKNQYGYDLAVPETWDQVKDQAIFFADPPNFYGTQYAGKDEAIVGRFYELVVAEGGNYLDENFMPAFNSDAGQRALQWFVDLYEAGAVPAGTTNYVWDDLGQGFASGTIALNLDWPGWAGFFNDPESSKAAGNVGVAVQPMGSVTRTGWSGHHGFSVTRDCPNREAAVSLVTFLTSEESQIAESAGGSLPTRTAVWDANVAAARAGDDPFRAEALAAFAEGAKYAFAVPAIPEWGETTNIVFPELQAAIVGDKTVKEALDDAADAVDALMRESGYY